MFEFTLELAKRLFKTLSFFDKRTILFCKSLFSPSSSLTRRSVSKTLNLLLFRLFLTAILLRCLLSLYPILFLSIVFYLLALAQGDLPRAGSALTNGLIGIWGVAPVEVLFIRDGWGEKSIWWEREVVGRNPVSLYIPINSLWNVNDCVSEKAQLS